MTLIESLFRLGADCGPSAYRFRVIRPVYETVAVQALAEDYRGHDPVTSPLVISAMFRFLTAETKEHVFAIHLDSKNKLLCLDHISTGSMSASIVHPREVFKSALLSSAASIILVHNHPSGDPAPSREDIEITKRLKDAGELLGIRFLDHVIIGDGYHSLADGGHL